MVLDLKRMNRILEVNEQNAYALVEPGVSYFDLYRYIQEKGLKLWVDVPDPGWGSPIGNSLDRGGGYLMPEYRNHFDSHCGMEVVLANGEVMRTGMGALPGAKTWQQYKSGFGPWIDGMFSQSNFGVVTKMGFWLMPEPDAYLSGTVTVSTSRRSDSARGHSELPGEHARHHRNARTRRARCWAGRCFPKDRGHGSGQGRSVGGDAVTPDPELTALLAKAGGDHVAGSGALRSEEGHRYWSCKLSFYGAPKANAANWEFAKEKFSAIPGAKFEDGESYKLPLTPEQRDKVHKPQFGIPSLAMFSDRRAIGRSIRTPSERAHLVLADHSQDGRGDFRSESRVLAGRRGILDLPFLGFSLPSTVIGRRAFIYIFAFPITHDVETNKKNRASFKRLVQIAGEHGWGEYRTPPAFQDAIMNTYSFNNHALLRFHETVKDAVDPNGILSAGRYGIWPKHLRDAKARAQK